MSYYMSLDDIRNARLREKNIVVETPGHCMLTMATKNIMPLCMELYSNKVSYATTYGMTIICDTVPGWIHLPATFSKVLSINRCLDAGYATIVWADMDVAFTNFRKDIRTVLPGNCWLAGLHESKHRIEWTNKYICAGLMVIRNCEQARSFFKRVAQMIVDKGLTESVNKHPYEQAIINSILADIKWEGLWYCHPDEIGSFWTEMQEAPVSRMWRQGDIHVHLGGGSWEMRREVFVKKYAGMIVR